MRTFHILPRSKREEREKMMIRRTVFLCIAVSILSVVRLLPVVQAEDAGTDALAKDILARAGVRGGLIVHLGCGDGQLAVALAARGPFLVHGLATDWHQVQAARQRIQAAGRYGKVSVAQLRGTQLPYSDNLVSLLISESPQRVARAEIMRVLQPDGVALVRAGDRWERIAKPRSAALDQWTHYLHDASNDAVSHDKVVGPPERFQWITGPRWGRSHDHLASLSAMVSAGDRVFYIVDEGPIAYVAMPSRWTLVARNAFNGVLLWKRKINHWEGHLRGFRSGPTELARRLVAVGDKVYVTLGYGAPISQLDAATGKTLQEYKPTAMALEFVVDQGRMFAVVGDRLPQNTDGAARRQNPDNAWYWWTIRADAAPRKRLVAVETATGRLLWEKNDAVTEKLYPTTLAVAGDKLAFQSDQGVFALDARDGKQLWHDQRPTSRQRLSWSTPTLVISGQVVLSGDRAANSPIPGMNEKTANSRWVVSSQGGIAPVGQLIAYDLASGRRLWESTCREGYNSPVDLLVANGLVWSGSLVLRRDPGITVARDLLTGEVRKQRPRDQEQFTIQMSHHRCYRDKATDKYLILGRDGIEFIDTTTGQGVEKQWVRGTCQYGVMPANGLVYAPPHSCACHIESKLNGFNVLASAPAPVPRLDAAERLVRGRAYSRIDAQAGSERFAGQWPTYRGDAQRSGVASTDVPEQLETAWHADFPGARLSSLVVADDKVLVASIDAHAVLALDARSGARRWTFVAGGRVDSPPTVYGNAVLFGCADGWIYCLNAASGELAWRFRAARTDRRIVAYEQLESAWPVPGSVLVQDGTLYAVAGRTPELPDGLTLYRLDPVTGKLLSATPVSTPALPDVLSSDGESVYLRHRRFDSHGVAQKTLVPHLYSPAGFLDDSWWHRTYWMFGTNMRSGWGAWPISGNQVPAGRILVVDGKTVYGFGRLNQYHRNGSHVGLGTTRYLLYASAIKPAAPPRKQARRTGKLYEKGNVPTLWQEPLPLMARAMLKSADRLYVAGPPDLLTYVKGANIYPYRLNSAAALEAQEASMAGKKGAMLNVVSATDGKTLASYPLAAPPAWDGMAAADQRLFIALTNGHVVCLAGKQTM